MKKYLLIAAGFLLAAGLTFVLLNRDSGSALHVNQVAADPAAYAGTITVTGVMGATSSADASLFGIFDLKELQCKTPNCNKFYLPIRYRGALPQLGDEVRVTGTFVSDQGGTTFVAESVKVLRNHRIGG